jgi:hypothetical protein
MQKAKKQARLNGNWQSYKVLQQKQLSTPATDPQDPKFRRLRYCRYADDFVLGIIGSKADAIGLKDWLGTYLKNELQLELSIEKTLVTNAKQRIRFLGYAIKRWEGTRFLKYHSPQGNGIKRTTTHQLQLLLPRDKGQAFAKKYGNCTKWKGTHRAELINLSELEILMIYNAEIRGFLGYYALAANLKVVAAPLLWLTSGSFFRTLASKRKSSLYKVLKSLKKGPAQFAVTAKKKDGSLQNYYLLASTKYLKQAKSKELELDLKPSTVKYRNRTELGERLQAAQCEWCKTRTAKVEVHHIRKLSNLKGKAIWERQMIERQRKTLILCARCHDELHAGRLKELKH